MAVATAERTIESAETLLVRSIEWTVVEADIHDTAPGQANVILRPVSKVAEGSAWHLCSSTCYVRNLLLSARLCAAEHLEYPQFFLLGDARARDGVPGAQGSTCELGHTRREYGVLLCLVFTEVDTGPTSL